MSNLRKRLITGTALALGMTAILLGDGGFDPQKRFLPFCMICLAAVTSLELMALLSLTPRGVFVVLPATLVLTIGLQWFQYHWWQFDWRPSRELTPIAPFIGVPPVVVLLVAIGVIALFREPDEVKKGQVLSSLFLLLYLGLPPLFLMAIQHRPYFPGTLALAATIFVPKLGDVGAFFTGTLIGKHKMAPRLSPKKTWEGFAGGMVVAMLTAAAINEIGSEPLFKGGVLQAMLFGLVVGLAGVLGDLFESAIKRRANAKDASASVPGFGGVLDVVDSVLFAAPAAYLFFVLMS